MYFQPRKKPAAIHMNHGKLDTDKNNEWAFSWVSHWWMETSNLVGSLAGPLNQALVFSLPSTQNQNQSLENKQTTIGFDSNNQLYWLSLQSSSNIPMNKSIEHWFCARYTASTGKVMHRCCSDGDGPYMALWLQLRLQSTWAQGPASKAKQRGNIGGVLDWTGLGWAEKLKPKLPFQRIIISMLVF